MAGMTGLRLFIVLMALTLLSACATLERQPAVPQARRLDAKILDIPNARFFSDQVSLMSAEHERSLVREARRLGIPSGALPTASFLSLSGGGDDGAFGAGLLVGWTRHGTRPKFKIVTGISTGALIAPFAFLGSDYDVSLKALYTETDQSHIFVRRPFTAAITDDAMADSSPLFATISRHFDDEMMLRIAREYQNGRLLFIQTTDLDSGHPVIWNIGAIAALATHEARNLIRRIILASASVPGAFPPIMFNVHVENQPHQEMHVDGSAVSQGFLYPSAVNVRASDAVTGFHRRRIAYVIRNARLHTEWKDVERQTLAVATKALSTLINYNGAGDLFRMYIATKKDGVGFNLASIGNDFTQYHSAEFDQTYMRALFAYGYEQGQAGYPWQKRPPEDTDASARSLRAVDHPSVSHSASQAHR